MIVRNVTDADRARWLEMRGRLWPEQLESLPAEVDRFFAGDAQWAQAAVVAEQDGELIGFAEFSVRPFAECWALTQGCTEFASDADPDNETSLAAHLACGFRDAGLARCFAKRLEAPSSDD